MRHWRRATFLGCLISHDNLITSINFIEMYKQRQSKRGDQRLSVSFSLSTCYWPLASTREKAENPRDSPALHANTFPAPGWQTPRPSSSERGSHIPPMPLPLPPSASSPHHHSAQNQSKNMIAYSPASAKR